MDLIEGRLGIIETARVLSKLKFLAGIENDADLDAFVAIDSETDELPVGGVRKQWAAHSLALQDVAIAKAEVY
jgi:hypothetical protein